MRPLLCTPVGRAEGLRKGEPAALRLGSRIFSGEPVAIRFVESAVPQLTSKEDATRISRHRVQVAVVATTVCGRFEPSSRTRLRTRATLARSPALRCRCSRRQLHQGSRKTGAIATRAAAHRQARIRGAAYRGDCGSHLNAKNPMIGTWAAMRSCQMWAAVPSSA